MTEGSNYEFDATSPVDAGFLSSDFGILFPSENGFEISKQTGGVAVHQLSLSGEFLPLGRPRINRGFPDWMPRPNGVPKGETHPVAEVDLTSIPDRDYESLPPWVAERGHFYNYDEFSTWWDSDEVWWYGWTDLVEELRKWNYDPEGEIQDRDMTEAWDGLSDIWAAIDDCLNFTYDQLGPLDERLDRITMDDDPGRPFEEYPSTREGIRWIELTGSKYYDGSPIAAWAEELAGTKAMLLYPNSD